MQFFNGNPDTMDRATPEPRNAFNYFRRYATLWRDNDAYLHVNNAVHYAWFDAIVNAWLIERGQLVLGQSTAVGLVVANSCQYFSPVAFPDDVTAGLRLSRLGASSVTYEIGLFRNDEAQSLALGSLTHVYVNAATRRPVPMPAALREALAELRRG